MIAIADFKAALFMFYFFLLLYWLCRAAHYMKFYLIHGVL